MGNKYVDTVEIKIPLKIEGQSTSHWATIIADKDLEEYALVIKLDIQTTVGREILIQRLIDDDLIGVELRFTEIDSSITKKEDDVRE